MIARLKRWALDVHHRTSRLPQGQRVCASIARRVGFPVESLLDVGCGDGMNMQRVGALVQAQHVVGVDVVKRPGAIGDVREYDGQRLPFGERAFDVVTAIDVLHHCDHPIHVLREMLRVARRLVLIKDHFAFGQVTDRMLYLMDLVGNAKDGIASPGNYLSPRQWVGVVRAAGGRIVSLDWPLKTHDMPWRLVGWPELQFTAGIEPVGRGQP